MVSEKRSAYQNMSAYLSFALLVILLITANRCQEQNLRVEQLEKQVQMLEEQNTDMAGNQDILRESNTELFQEIMTRLREYQIQLVTMYDQQRQILSALASAEDKLDYNAQALEDTERALEDTESKVNAIISSLKNESSQTSTE